MPEEISIQMLTQATENVQKLFELSTRIDERVKLIQLQQESLDRKFEDLTRRNLELIQKVAVLESKDVDGMDIFEKIGETQGEIVELDKRICALEGGNARSADRWNRIATFMIQLVWVVLAAYMLTKLNLQPPAVP
jgi:hypothetical protein